MSAVGPKVYQFSPSAKTGAAVINGVKRCLDAAGLHHWEYTAYTLNSTITLIDKATRTRQLRLVAVTSPNVNVQAYYTILGVSTESYACLMGGGGAGYAILDSSWGMSDNLAYVIELEDAITIATAKSSTSGGSGIQTNALTFSIHAGRILSTHNRSDALARIGEEGVVCGQAMTYTDSCWAWFAQSTTAGGTASQSAIWAGNGFIRICHAVGTLGLRDTRSAAVVPLISGVGDTGAIERLVPIPIAGPISGTLAGHFAYTRYFRARRYGVTDTPPGGITIANGDVYASAGSPTTIGWRHTFGYNVTNCARNSIHIWCPSGQEVVVP